MPQILDQYGKVVSWVHYDEADDLTRIGQTQDVEPIIEENKRLQNLNDGYSPSREFKRVASIPFTIFENWLKEDGLTWMHYWRMGKKEQRAYRARRLLSSDWRDLRTTS